MELTFRKYWLEEKVEDRTVTSIRFIRRVVTFRTRLNALLRMPRRTEIVKLKSGAVAIRKNFGNKKVITVAHDVPLRVRLKI